MVYEILNSSCNSVHLSRITRFQLNGQYRWENIHNPAVFKQRVATNINHLVQHATQPFLSPKGLEAVHYHWLSTSNWKSQWTKLTASWTDQRKDLLFQLHLSPPNREVMYGFPPIFPKQLLLNAVPSSWRQKTVFASIIHFFEPSFHPCSYQCCCF